MDKLVQDFLIYGKDAELLDHMAIVYIGFKNYHLFILWEFNVCVLIISTSYSFSLTPARSPSDRLTAQIHAPLPGLVNATHLIKGPSHRREYGASSTATPQKISSPHRPLIEMDTFF